MLLIDMYPVSRIRSERDSDSDPCLKQRTYLPITVGIDGQRDNGDSPWPAEGIFIGKAGTEAAAGRRGRHRAGYSPAPISARRAP